MKTDSFGVRVPVRDIGTILYFYHREIGGHGLTIGGCLRDVISQAAANIRSSRPEMDLDEEQAGEIISQLKKTGNSGPDFNFSLPKPARLAVPEIDPKTLIEAAREISREEEPKSRPQFETDIIDD